MIFTNTLLTSALSDYYLYKTTNVKDNIFQILGVTGGLIKLFELINNLICKYMLKIMRYFILIENKKIKLSKEKIKKIKLEQNMKLFNNLDFEYNEQIERINLDIEINNTKRVELNKI